MKKSLSLMLSVIMILQIVLPMTTVIWESGFTNKSFATVLTGEEKINNIVWGYWMDTSSDKVEIYPKEYWKLPTDVTIPSKIKGYTVTAIRENAFDRCENLVSVTISNGIKEIQEFAFENCYNLTSITIPSSVTSIGASAFSECRNLTSITIPSSVTSIGASAFSECENLTSVTMSSGVKTIGNGAFFNCNKLTSITIPSSVTSIGAFAFSECRSLTKIVIPDSITTIKAETFKGCINLQNVTIGNKVKSIETETFNGCIELKSITIPNNVTSIGDYAFQNCDGLTSVTLSNSLTKIALGTFYGCLELKSITIPSSVTSIGDYAFLSCVSLTSITMLSGVKTIGNNAFFNCNSLKSITIPSSVTSIGDYAFQECDGLTSIIIPQSVKSLGEGAFSGCSNLKDVTIGTPEITNKAFNNCTSLTNVIINDTVTKIGSKAFYGCYSLESLEIASSVTSIDSGAFLDAYGLTIYCKSGSEAEKYAIEWDLMYALMDEIKEISGVKWSYKVENGEAKNVRPIEKSKLPEKLTIPSSIDGKPVTSIGEEAFVYCDNLTSVTIPNSVEVIGDDAFKQCRNLKTLIIPEGVKRIGEKAFFDCNKLTKITIPNSVTNIEDYAFDNCSNLKSITILSSETDIGKWAFRDCDELTIYCPSDSKAEQHAKAYGVNYKLINKTNGVTWLYELEDEEAINVKPFEKSSLPTNITIPSELDGRTVTSIGASAFEDCTSITSVTIPDSVKSVGKWAFEGCTGLTSIEIPNSVTSMEKGAFANCYNLANITIPNKLTSLEESVFEETKVQLVIIPESITSIGKWALCGCTNLTNIVIPSTVTSIDDLAFANCNNDLKIYCRSGSTAQEYADAKGIDYVLDDKAPTINIETNPAEWIKEGAEVTITIKAEEIVTGLASEAYSFDGGKNWQPENTSIKTYKSDEVIEVQVRDKVGNVATEEIEIKIDEEAPRIDSVEGISEDWAKGELTLKVNASDTLSGIAGYSFDGGKNWQPENYKEYEENTNGIEIKVKDIAGNETTYREVIDITRILKLDHIEITTPPDNTTYAKNENFDRTGMVIKAVYNNPQYRTNRRSSNRLRSRKWIQLILKPRKCNNKI